MSGGWSAVAERVRILALPLVQEEGLELVDVEYRREARGWVLRLILDKPGGVTLADCQRVSEQLGDLLDVEEPFAGPYHLEVSSPGLDRPLRTPADFVRFVGRRARITTREPIEGQRRFRGVLQGLEADTIVLEAEGGRRVAIPRAGIAKARLEVDWDQG